MKESEYLTKEQLRWNRLNRKLDILTRKKQGVFDDRKISKNS